MPAPAKKRFNTIEAAKYLDLSPRTLEGRRSLGLCPPFQCSGRNVNYKIEDLDEFPEKYSTPKEFDELDEEIEKIVSNAPKLTEQQAAKIVSVLMGGVPHDA